MYDHPDATTRPTPTPRTDGSRPIPPDVEYHRVLAGPKRRIGRGIAAIVLLVVGGALISFGVAQAAGHLDLRLGRVNPAMGGTEYTPIFHAASMFGLALLIPWSMLIQRWLYGVRGAWLHSVLSRFRLDVFGRALLIIGPVWLIPTVVMTVAASSTPVHWSTTDLVGIFAATLLLTPLQAAGEEYGLRGLVFRIAGGWSRGRRAGLVLGVLVSSLGFTALHGSSDPWINGWYVTLAVSLAVITWRTGGLETAIVVHALLNTLTLLLATVLHADLTDADRSAGAGSVVLLAPSVTVAVIAAVVWWGTRREGPARTPVA